MTKTNKINILNKPKRDITRTFGETKKYCGFETIAAVLRLLCPPPGELTTDEAAVAAAAGVLLLLRDAVATLLPEAVEGSISEPQQLRTMRSNTRRSLTSSML